MNKIVCVSYWLQMFVVHVITESPAMPDHLIQQSKNSLLILRKVHSKSLNLLYGSFVLGPGTLQANGNDLKQSPIFYA